MKKIFIPALIFTIIGFSVYKYGVRRLFTPSAVQRVRAETIENLNKEIIVTEKKYKEKLVTAEKVALLYKRLGKKLVYRKNWTPAVNAFKKAIEFGSSGSKVHHLLAVAYANRGRALSSSSDINKAINHYKIALSINNKILDTYYGLAMLYYYQKDLSKAMGLLKKIIIMDSKFYSARFALGFILHEEGKYSQSLSIYEELLSDLEKRRDSSVMKQYKESCRNNISQLMQEIKNR